MCGGFETFSSDAGASKWAKKKGNLSGPIKVCEENYSHTQKKNIRDAVGQLARPLESL